MLKNTKMDRYKTPQQQKEKRKEQTKPNERERKKCVVHIESVLIVHNRLHMIVPYDIYLGAFPDPR